MNKSSKILLWVVLGAVILLLGITLFTSFYSPATEIKFSEYEEKIANVDASERVTTIVVDDYIYKGYNANGKYIFFAYGDRGDYTAQKLDEWTGKFQIYLHRSQRGQFLVVSDSFLRDHSRVRGLLSHHTPDAGRRQQGDELRKIQGACQFQY